MISKCKLYLMFIFILLSCNTSTEYNSPIKENEQLIIRTILNMNGYNIADSEPVDQYIRKVTDYHTGNWYGTYNLMLPNTDNKIMVLTDDLNSLIESTLFNGKIYTPFSTTIDSIIVITDSIIYIPDRLSLGEHIVQLPTSINKIRTPRLLLRDNKFTIIPEEIIELTSPPFPFDTFYIDISGNSIDTTTISDTLDKWLQKYYSPYWKNTQVYE